MMHPFEVTPEGLTGEEVMAAFARFPKTNKPLVTNT